MTCVAVGSQGLEIGAKTTGPRCRTSESCRLACNWTKHKKDKARNSKGTLSRPSSPSLYLNLGALFQRAVGASDELSDLRMFQKNLHLPCSTQNDVLYLYPKLRW